ncbi:MAG TPA: hypothetical protein DCX06_14110 [Opitutae bacterium]|nr:hypothetical protein [Opitutae bacterium]
MKIRVHDLTARDRAGKPVDEYPFSEYEFGLSPIQLDRFSMLPGIEQVKVQSAIQRGEIAVGKSESGLELVFNPLPFNRKERV